jgi:hypothetical protein
MHRSSHLGFREPPIGSTPSEALSFATSILEQRAGPCVAGNDGRAIDWEQLAWSASISSRKEEQLRRLTRAGQIHAREREQLERLAGISAEHERQFQDMLRKEAAAAEVRRRAQQCLEKVERLREGLSWDPARHPRLGGPPNAGWFAPTGGSVTSTSSDTIVPSKPDSLFGTPQHDDQYLAQAPAAPEKKEAVLPSSNIETLGPTAGTPRTPQGDGLAIAVFGEDDNPKFKDYSTDPEFDKYTKNGKEVTRPNTSSLPDKSVTDISIRGAPINKASWKEIIRISKPGAHVTIAGPKKHVEALYKQFENGDLLEGAQYDPRLVEYNWDGRQGVPVKAGTTEGAAFVITITKDTRVAK